MKKSHRNIISAITIVLLVFIVWASWNEIMHAWRLLATVNLWILALLIPVQFIAYYAAGEMMFDYLRDKGALKHVSRLSMARMALELNFVNHILPSGGVSGISYMTWRLGKLGVQPARATMAQVVRYVTGFLAFIALLLVSVVAVTVDEGVNRLIILASSVVASVLIFSIVFGIYIISSRSRLHSFAGWSTRVVNSSVKKITFGRKTQVVQQKVLEKFFADFHDDYVELSQDKRLLIKPFLWGLLFTASDVALFMIGFWALGYVVNPAPVVIAYGLASFAGFLLLTPGGAGAYEAIMVSFLSIAGIPQGAAIAAIILTRVIVLIGTIISGYVFYQLTLLKYGKHTTKR